VVPHLASVLCERVDGGISNTAAQLIGTLIQLVITIENKCVSRLVTRSRADDYRTDVIGPVFFGISSTL